jgi:uncharacterized protein YdhG (YjbR/CyaY superfamily)
MKKANSDSNSAKAGPAKTIDEYLAALPAEFRTALGKIRKTIRAAAPNATEVISYQIPAYKHRGLLVGFAAATNHCTFHIMSVKVTREHAADLKGYKTGKASIRFTPDEQIPAALITKLVKARIAENEAGRGYRGRN